MGLDALIEKLECAEHGSGELSWLVAEHLGWTKEWSGITIYHRPLSDARDPTTELPRYTTSLDAALMLVPEGWQWEVRSVPTDEGINHSAQVNWEPNGRVYAESPALALCIAALKARRTSHSKAT